MATDLGSAIVPTIVSLAGSGFLIAAVQGLFTRRKTQAETQGAGANATKTITDAAAGVVAMLTADNKRLESRLGVVEGRLAECQARCDALTAWKEAAEPMLAAHGLIVATPPRRSTEGRDVSPF